MKAPNSGKSETVSFADRCSIGEPRRTGNMVRQVGRSLRAIVYLSTLAILVATLVGFVPYLRAGDAPQRTADDWQYLYTYIRTQIVQDGQNWSKGQDLKRSFAYVRGMELLAKDREAARKALQEAQTARGDEAARAFIAKFRELVDLAQQQGDGVLGGADFLFRIEDERGQRNSWAQLCLVVENDGKTLFEKAKELKFNHDLVRQYVKIDLQTARKDLDTGWSLRCNSGYCGYLYPNPQRDPLREANQGLSWVEHVRVLAGEFELAAEREAATDLMSRYLIDTLCLMDKGHSWYLDLAKKYGLGRAKEHIEGFYATLYGKVELNTKSGKKPAKGARVVMRDPHDKKELQAITDGSGNYEIKKALMHQRCGPFDAKADYLGATATKSYPGPLTKPNPEHREKLDLLVTPALKGWFEFEYEMEAKFPTAQTTAKGYDKHTVPFSVNFDHDPPRIEGQGEFQPQNTITMRTAGGQPMITMTQSRPGGPITVNFPGITLTVPKGAKDVEKLVGVGTEGGSAVKWKGTPWIVKLYGELDLSDPKQPKLDLGYRHVRGSEDIDHGRRVIPLVDGTAKVSSGFPFPTPGYSVSTKYTVRLKLDMTGK